jgi:hypothetical protein
MRRSGRLCGDRSAVACVPPDRSGALQQIGATRPKTSGWLPSSRPGRPGMPGRDGAPSVAETPRARRSGNDPAWYEKRVFLSQCCDLLQLAGPFLRRRGPRHRPGTHPLCATEGWCPGYGAAVFRAPHSLRRRSPAYRRPQARPALRQPGRRAAARPLLDRHPMHRQGRSRRALHRDRTRFWSAGSRR